VKWLFLVLVLVGRWLVGQLSPVSLPSLILLSLLCFHLLLTALIYSMLQLT
jgi:hypothetical protein